MAATQQRIITITREFGSGGQAVARKLAESYGIPLYEKNILELTGIPWSAEVEDYYTSDTPRFLFSRQMRGMTRTNEELFVAMESQFLQEQAAAGASFVVLGHCAEYILRNNPHVFSVFISANEDFKIRRTMEIEQVSLAEAKKMCKRHNRKRKAYQKQYSPWSWGNPSHYDLCIRTDAVGIDGGCQVIETMADLFFENAGQPVPEASDTEDGAGAATMEAI